MARLHNLENLVGIALHNVAKWSLAILTAPYYLLFWRYHKGTIDEALSLGSDEAMAQRVFDWLNIKRREAIFIQAAGAVTFASIVSAFSWSGLEKTHWLVPACWYASLLFAVASIFTGAQQTMLIEHLNRSDSVNCFKISFWTGNDSLWSILFAWQVPIMFLWYSLLLFLIGLSVHIVSPVVQKREFNDEAKTMIWYFVFMAVAAFTFWSCSRVVHRTVARSTGTVV